MVAPRSRRYLPLRALGALVLVVVAAILALRLLFPLPPLGERTTSAATLASEDTARGRAWGPSYGRAPPALGHPAAPLGARGLLGADHARAAGRGLNRRAILHLAGRRDGAAPARRVESRGPEGRARAAPPRRQRHRRLDEKLGRWTRWPRPRCGSGTRSRCGAPRRWVTSSTPRLNGRIQTRASPWTGWPPSSAAATSPTSLAYGPANDVDFEVLAVGPAAAAAGRLRWLLGCGAAYPRGADIALRTKRPGRPS